MMFTILGSTGFVGSHLIAKFRREKVDYFTPAKFEDISGIKLGHVIDCAGLTADFRTRPFDTVEAHVCRLLKILRQYKFDSFLYLSSTRVYRSREGIAHEEDVIYNQPLVFDNLFNISKIMGESLCFASERDNVRVARLSNVYGYDNQSEDFIFTIIRDALRERNIVLKTTLDSSKDHINVNNVVNVLPKIALYGKQNIYNVASGENTTVKQIAIELTKLTGCRVEVSGSAERICFPIICIDRIKDEFAYIPSNVIDDLGNLVCQFKNGTDLK